MEIDEDIDQAKVDAIGVSITDAVIGEPVPETVEALVNATLYLVADDEELLAKVVSDFSRVLNSQDRKPSLKSVE